MGEDAQDIFFLEDEALFVFDPQLAAGILVEQHLIADLDVLDLLADRLHDAPLRLFLRRIRHINSAGRAFHFLGMGDEQTITQGWKFFAAVDFFSFDSVAIPNPPLRLVSVSALMYSCVKAGNSALTCYCKGYLQKTRHIDSARKRQVK